MLTPREIIAKSWAVTTTEIQLKRWGFFGSFFEILLDVKLLVYQIYFIYSYFKGEGGGLFDIEIMLYNAIPFWLFVTLISGFILLVIVELFVPSFADGAIIGLTAKAHGKEKVRGGFVLAVYNFFPILAVHEVFIFSSFSIFITAISVILRYGGGFKGMMIVVATIVWLVSNVIKFFSSFTESGVVIEKLGIFAAGAKSVKLIMSYMPHVMFLAMLLFVISIRIFINTLVIVLVPLAMLGIGLGLTYVFQPIISYSIAGFVGLILTMVAAYFFTYLHVFKQAVWTIMYMELIKEKDMDKIG
ncbi:hypothetical protein EXS65_04700 [Candidatus Peribacteria bacterium]|nr:hypothetical protein [Candidatus Peribacteria bacterium]